MKFSYMPQDSSMLNILWYAIVQKSVQTLFIPSAVSGQQHMRVPLEVSSSPNAECVCVCVCVCVCLSVCESTTRSVLRP